MVKRLDWSSCSWSRSFKEYIGEITGEIILHGVKYIAFPNRHGCERVFWGIVVLSNLVFSICTVNHLLMKLWNSPVITTFESQKTSISRIPFPSISLCNFNIMKWSAMWEAKLKVEALMKTDERMETKELQNRIKVLQYMANTCLYAKSFRGMINDTLFDAKGNGDFVNKLKGDLENIEEEWNRQDPGLEQRLRAESLPFVRQFRQQASHNCSSMLQKCMLGRVFTSCRKLFQQVDTDHGVCCLFNWLPLSMYTKPRNLKGTRREYSNLSAKEISDWELFGKGDIIKNPRERPRREHPHYQSWGGQEHGLSLLINPELDVYSTCTANDGFGFKFLTSSSVSIPRFRDLGMGIPISSEVFVNVEPIVTVANEDSLKHVDVDVRGCYFPSDRRATLRMVTFYSLDSCLFECLEEETFKNCSCVGVYMLSGWSNRTICSARKFHCMDEVRVNLAATLFKSCSKCYPTCTEVKYKTHMSHFPLTQDTLDAFMKKNISKTGESFGIEASNYTILHVFFGMDTVHARERKMLYTAQDIFAQLGGVLTLTLGASIISLIQIVYFCTLRAWFGIRSVIQQNVNGKSPRLSAIVSSRLLEIIREREMAKGDQGRNNARPTKRINVRPASSKGIGATNPEDH